MTTVSRHNLGLNDLCEQCGAIDFVSVLKGRYSGPGKPISSLRTGFNGSCQLCHVASAMLQQSETYRTQLQTDSYHWRAFPPQWLSHSPVDKSLSGAVLMPVVGSAKYDIAHPSSGRVMGDEFLILDSCSMRPTDLDIMNAVNVRIVPPSCESSQFTQFGSMIENCAASHATCHEAERPWSGSFITKVIDCETRELVSLVPQMSYLALSYCWGDQNETISMVAETETVPRELPPTIADAIKVVTSLGKRYLWVDRYCILAQECPARQITKMNEIYQGAWCTVVALDGHDAYSGLSGMTRPRPQQFKVQTPAGTLISSHPHWTHEIRSSIWSTRAWCYQEAVLSPRTLVFTKHQVFFVCKQHVLSEAHNLSLGLHPTRSAFVLTSTDHWWAARSKRHLESFAAHVSEYTSRKLSFDRDALAAFKGIISFHKIFTYWALPIDSQSMRRPRNTEPASRSFAHSMAWTHETEVNDIADVRRRDGFPTWSWLSLTAKISLSHRLSQYTESRGITEWKRAKFAVPSEDAAWIDIQEYSSLTSDESYVLGGQHFGLLVESPTLTLQLASPNGALYQATVVSTEVFPNPCGGLAMVDEPLAFSRDFSKSNNITCTAVLLFDDSTSPEGDAYRHHESVWLLIDHGRPIAHRIGVAWMEFCLSESCRLPTCLHRHFIGPVQKLHLE